MENPLVRYGRKYVYDERGDLIEDFRGKEMFILTQDKSSIGLSST